MPTLPAGPAGGTVWNWTQEYTEDNGPEGTIVTAVIMTNWDSHIITNFPASMVGTAARGGGINRHVPISHPLKDWLYCTHCKLQGGIGYPDEETGNRMLKFSTPSNLPTKALWEVQFADLGYDVETNADTHGLAGNGKELFRYVSRKSQGSVEALPVEGTTWMFADTQAVIPEPTTILFANTELEYTWWWVPHPLPSALDILLGHVNEVDFDGRNGNPVYGQGQVYFSAYEKSDPLLDPQGRRCSHVTLRFLVRRTGWNKFWRPFRIRLPLGAPFGSPGFADVVSADGSGVTPFPESDLMNLFT